MAVGYWPVLCCLALFGFLSGYRADVNKPSSRCLVKDIHVLQDIDLNKFSGIWFDLARLPLRHEGALSSAGVSQIDVDKEGHIQIRYTQESEGACSQPVAVHGTSHQPSKFQLHSGQNTPNFLRGPYWVIDTDYHNYALVYGCYHVNHDGTCRRRHRLVYVIGRNVSMSYETERKLHGILTQDLCVDPRKLVFFQHRVGCDLVLRDPTLNFAADAPEEVTMTAELTEAPPRSCKFTDFPGHKDFIPSEVVGTWYVLATYRIGAVQPSTVSSASLYFKHTPEGGFDSYYTAAMNGQCLGQTFHGVLKKMYASNTEYYADYGRRKGPFKFVYFTGDYQYGLTYHCTVQLMDGSCGSASLDLIGRSKELPEAIVEELKQQAVQLCAEEKDFFLINQQESCPLKLGDERKCQVSNIKAKRRIDWKALQGYWYTTAAYRKSGQPSLTWYIDLWSYTAFRMHTQYAKDGKCIPTITSVVNFEPKSGTYYYKSDSQTYDAEILFLDGNTVVVVYECQRVQSDGTCDPEHISLQFNTRSRNISPAQLQTFKSLLNDACIRMDDLTFVSHDVNCDPTPKEQMYFERCIIDEIPVTQKLDMEKFSGHWHSLAVNKESIQLDTVEIDILSDGEGGAYLWYSGSRGGQCVSTANARLTPRSQDNRGEFIVKYSRFSSHLKVVSTDYDNYALLYECGQEDDQGHCMEGFESVEMLGREHVRSRPSLEDVAKEVLGKTCFSLQDLKHTDEQLSCHPVKEPEFCKIEEMATQPGFTIRQILGSWYRIGVNRERNHLKNIQLHIVLNSMNQVAVSLSYAVNDSCEPGKTMLGSVSKENPAVWYMNYGRTTGTTLISHLDEDFALLYHCTKVQADGTCAKMNHYVSVLARTRTLRGEALIRKDKLLREHLPELCTDPRDIVDVKHTGTCTPMVNHGKCKIDTLPVLRDFDIKKFLGTWYPIVRLKGSHTLDGSIIKFKEGADGKYYVISTGVGHQRDRCIPTTNGTLSTLSGHGAELYISYGNTKGRMRIIFTNYEVALVYTCDYETSDGRCFAGQTSVDILSRSRNPNSDLKFPLLRRVKDLCVDPKHMVDVDHKTIECELDPAQGCTVDQVPVPDGISRTQNMGTWYSAAKLRGSASWESGSIHFSLRTSPTRHVEARITGSRRGVCLPTKKIKLYPGSKTGIIHVGEPDSQKLIKIVAYSEDSQYALFYQCDAQTADGHCEPDQTYIDVLSRNREPLPTHIADEFAELAYKYLCQHRLQFILTAHDVQCEVDLSKKCPVDEIHVQTTINPDDLLGEWYAYSALDNELFTDSSRFVVERTDKDLFIVRFTASRDSSCFPTSIADLVIDASTPGRAKLSHNGLEADFLVLYADTQHLLFYECYQRRQDGTCFPEKTAVAILTRRGQRPFAGRVGQLAKLIGETCYSDDQMKLVSHSVPCEVQMETPKKCDMSNLPIQRNVALGQLLGQWYIVARLGSAEWSSGSAHMEVIEGSDMVRVHYVVALRGRCLPTKMVTWIPAAQGHSEWQSIIGGLRGYAAIIYLDEEHLVVYECDVLASATECSEEHAFFEVYSRSQEPMDYTVMSKLSHSAARMCLRVDDFEEVAHDLTCNIDHEPVIDCQPEELTLAENFDLERATGTWYGTLRLKGSGYMNSYQMRITKAENSGYILHVVGSRKAACLPEQHQRLQPRVKDNADLLLTTDQETVSVHVLYFEPHYHYMVVSECALYQSDGKCTPGHGTITVFSRFLDNLPQFITTEVLPSLGGECLQNLEFEAVPHGVACPVHGEGDDEYCDYNTIRPQDDFEAEKFVGVWYHMYRLRSSAQKYDSEVNYVDLMPDGKLRSYSTYYNDGKCSSTKTSMYMPTRHKGEWWYGSYGGIKIVYTDYEVAVIYVCSHSHYDDSCFPKDSEIEVLSRRVSPLTASAEWKVKRALRSICLEIGDFDATRHDVTCNVKKIRCNFGSLPEHSGFNMEMFTGTWFPVARLRNTLSTKEDIFRVSKSTQNPSMYTLVYKMGLGGQCSSPITSQWNRKSAATFVSSEKFRNSLFRVLYTDYTTAIFYICHELFNSSTCLPGEETVYVLSHDPDITEKELGQVISNVPETCFSKRSFEWMPRELHCSIPPSLCPVDELPAEKNFNLQAFAGVWYGMHQVRGHGDWQNGVVEYRVSADGNLIITGTGTRDGECAQPTSYISLAGDNVWDWHVVIGWMTGYVRILDASDVGDDHAVLFECDRILETGVCDPQFAFIDVISRSQVPFNEEGRVHLRNVIRDACFEPGDFGDAQHDVMCDVTKVPDITCKPAQIPTAEDFSLKRYSGDWFVVAKINSSSVPESSRLHVDYQGEALVKVYFVGHRARRSCTPIRHFTFNVSPSNPAKWLLIDQSDNITQEFRVIWTDYEVAVVYVCFHQLEDDVCRYGYEHVLVLNRNAGRPSKKTINSIDALTGHKDACLNRNNFRWLNHEVTCDLPLPKREACTVENVRVTASFSEQMSMGVWYMRYSLRRDSLWQNGKLLFKQTQGHNYKALYTIGIGSECFQGSSYGYATNVPGQFLVRFGKYPGLIKHLYQDKDYMISYTCSAMDDQGFCLPEEEAIGLFSRTLEPLPENVSEWIASVANTDCYEPGDFVPIQHTIDCEIGDKALPLQCDMAQLPIQEDFTIDKMTGTWYAMAAHRVNDLFPSTVIRLERATQEDYHIYFTSMGTKRVCRPLERSTLRTQTDRYPGEYSIRYGEIRGRIKVVYTDYHFALVYECLKLSADGGASECQRGEDFFIVYARTPELPDDAIHRMISSAGLTCLTTDQFALIHHPASCQITSPQLADVKCKVRNIHAQDNFDLSKFLGTWYSHYKLPSSWKSLITRYEKDLNGKIMAYYTGEHEGGCYPERSATVQLDNGGRAVLFGETVTSKVVYTDYNYAVLMTCEDILADGSCGKRRYIAVLSHDLQPIPVKKLERLMVAVREACFEPGDLVHTPHYVNCDRQRVLPCDVSTQLIGQQRFNMATLTGVWYNMASLKHGADLGWNVIRVTEEDAEGLFSLYSTGNRNGECTLTARVKLRPRYSQQTHPADLLILNTTVTEDQGVAEGAAEQGRTVGLMRVLYTNYDIALVYVCSGSATDLEKCPIGKLSIMAWSRTQVLSYTEMRQMVLATGQNCFQDDQFQWTNGKVECRLDIEEADSCKYANLELANLTEPTDIEGEWYTRYQLRGSPSLHSEHTYLRKLPDGDMKFYYTGSLNGHDCPDHTNTYVHQKTEDPAMFVVFADENGIQAAVKYLYADGTFILTYFCGKIRLDGSCDIKYSYFLFMSRERDTPIPSSVYDTLMSHTEKACFEPGQVRMARQAVECRINHDAETRCNLDFFKVAPEFDVDQYCGSWYPVAKVKGGFMSDNRMFRTEARAHDYVTYGVGAFGPECVKPAELMVNVTRAGEILTYTPDGRQLIGFSKVLNWGLEQALLYHCAKPSSHDNNLRCVEGYHVVAVMSRQPRLPGDEAMRQLLSSVRGCIHPDELEPVLQNVACPIRESVPDQCKVASIQGKASLSYGDILGKWHIHYTLRNREKAGLAQYGHSYFSMIDRTHIKGEFAFKVNGQCQSVETVYHASDSNPGEFLITIGSMPVTIKVIHQDDDYLVFYECDLVAEDGSCEQSGHFVMIFGRTAERASGADLKKLQSVVRGVCLEMGDFVALEAEGECEIKIDRRDIGCSLSKLPVQENFMIHKDTGHWYAVAKLKGSNFPNSLNEKGVIDYSNKQYTFYSTGQRGRGGCMPTVKKTIPFQVPGQSSVKVPITSFNHSGVWQMLYNDYRYALVFRCGHLLSADVCAPGQFYVVAYSRKRSRISQNMIDRMLWKISPACFTWDDFEWLNLEEECPLSYESRACRMRDIPEVENFHLDLFLGTWYSRYLLVKHTEYDSFAARYELTVDGMLKLYHHGVSNGGCRRMKEYTFIIPDRSRGVFRWGDNAEKIVKVMYTDYNYAVIYTCDRVQEDDTCVPDMEFIDIIGREISDIPVHVIEDFKQLLVSACYAPGDFVESDHTLQCDANSCTIGSVVTQRDVTAPSLFGSWQLIARTTHIAVARGPTTMEIMMGKDGNARFAMARHDVDGCKNYEVVMPVDHDNTFYYTYNDLPGLFKIIYRDADYLILYDCFGADPVNDFCEEENQEIQLWGRKYYLQESMLDKTMKIARERTCVNLNNIARVRENIACTVHKSCRFDDLVEQENFDPRSVLGNWELVAQSTFFESVFTSGNMRLGHTGDEDGSYQYTGALYGTGECASHMGKILRVPGKIALYHFAYKSLRSIGKYLYVDNDYQVLFECWGDLVQGVCPVNKTAFYIMGRVAELDDNKRVRLFREIRQRTFGCYDVKNIQMVTSNACQVTPKYIGRPSCKVQDIVGDKYFRPSDLTGLWFLVARSNLIDFKWDAGVLHSSIDSETGRIQIQYTGLISSEVQKCLKVFSIDVEVNQLENGFIESMSYVQGGKKTRAHILYIDDDTFVWYECHGNQLTPHGDCVRNMEQVDVYSRRKRVNTAQMAKLLGMIEDKTCLNMDKFVFANHTKKCHLPGITDVGILTNGEAAATKSCKVKDIPAQTVLNTTRFAGLWYEKERTRFSPHNTWESSLALYESTQTGSLTFRHAGTQRGLCRGPIVASAVPTQPGSGDMKLYVGTESVAGSPWASHYVYKVLYTDYDTAITYACKFVRQDGTCGHHARQVDILSRTKDDLTEDVYQALHQIIRDTLCVDIHDFVTPVYQEDCHPLLGVLVPTTVHACPSRTCSEDLVCPHGYITDYDGCPTCECLSPIDEVQAPCAVPVCAALCPNGHLRDEQGCETCDCMEEAPAEVKPACATPMCAAQCPNGYTVDENGCQTCDCIQDNPVEVKPLCVSPMCAARCPDGYTKDENGCQTCDCVQVNSVQVKPPCATPMCASQCPNGYAKDENDCPTCNCINDTPAAVKLPCAIPMCANRCPNGYAQDENGCETCICNIAEEEESSGEAEEEVASPGVLPALEEVENEVVDHADIVEELNVDEEGDELSQEELEQEVERLNYGPCTELPPRVQYGTVSSTTLNHGDTAIYECWAGYLMEGNYYVTCEHGEWVGDLPTCEAVSCRYHGDLANGKVWIMGKIGKYEYRSYVKLLHDDQIEYVCNPGYRVVGPSTAYCVDGVWSPQLMPRCDPVELPPTPTTQQDSKVTVETKVAEEKAAVAAESEHQSGLLGKLSQWFKHLV